MDKLLSGRRVLVVEDEMMVLMNIELMLGDLGCKDVSAAATVNQAVAMIDAQVFDAAMLDVNLNGDKSFAVADMLAAHGIPFMFSTGYGPQGVADNHIDRPVLNKPYHRDDLAKIFATFFPADLAAVPAE